MRYFVKYEDETEEVLYNDSYMSMEEAEDLYHEANTKFLIEQGLWNYDVNIRFKYEREV